MPIAVDCPCGKTLRLRDDLAGMRVKCPECGNAVDVPEQSESVRPIITTTSSAPASPVLPTPQPERTHRHGDQQITGKPVVSYNGVLLPTFFGTAELSFGETRLNEETRKLLSARHAQFLLSEIESGEILTHRNPMFLILGLATLWIFGLGLLFLIPYFLLKYKSLVIHSQANVAAISIQGDDEPYFDFLDAVLDAAKKTKTPNVP